MPEARKEDKKTTGKAEAKTVELTATEKEQAQKVEKAEKEAERLAKANEELQKQLDASAKLEKQLKDSEDARIKLEEEAKKKASAVVEDEVVVPQPKEVKLVKVSFIENHSFNIGNVKVNAKKGDTENVERHLANKFVSRKIAYILG